MPPEGWSYRALRDLVDDRGITYGVVQPGHEVPDGVPVLRVNNFNGSGLDLQDVLHIAPGIESAYRRSRLRGGEVLITLVGTIGLTAIAPPEVADWNVARAVGVIPLRNPELARWVRWCLLAPDAVRHLDSRLNTTVQKTLNLGDLSQLEIPIPPDEEIAAIKGVLAGLDDKIQNNDVRCSIHADLIQAVFSHRIVNHPDSSSWDAGDLTTLARFVNGRAFTNDATGTGRPVLRIKELNSGITDNTVFNEVDASDENVARHHDLLFAWSGSLDVYRWQGPEALINQHIFKVLPHTGFPTWFVEGWIRTHLREFKAIAKDKATTMGHIKREHLTAAKVRIPPPEVLTELDLALAPLDAQIGALAAETISVRAVRDALLPKLVSGDIRVPPDTAADEGEELAA